jgi:hypothetical protein
MANAGFVPDNTTRITLPPYARDLSPIENAWPFLRTEKRDHRLRSVRRDRHKCREIWNFFGHDHSITSRSWAAVVLKGRWYKRMTLGLRSTTQLGNPRIRPEFSACDDTR